MTATGSKSEPQNWSRRLTPGGPELVFAIRGGRGFLLSWLVATACLVGFSYGTFFILEGWLIDRSEILAGGVVFLLVMLAGMAFGVYAVFRLLGTTTYLLAPDRLRVTTGFPVQRVTMEIQRDQIGEILQVYTPPRESGTTGTWKTLVSYSTPDRKHRDFALEGWSEEETRWVGSIISEWASVPLKSTLSGGFEEADDDEKPVAR